MMKESTTNSSWNKENVPASTMMRTAALNNTTATSVPQLTTLWVEGFETTDQEQDIRHLFRVFAPIVCVERPHDKQGNPRSHVFITLLSQHADKAIEMMNGRRVNNDWISLKVQKAKKERRVAVAVVKKVGRKRVCRAFRHGQCLQKCPFGLHHTRR